MPTMFIMRGLPGSGKSTLAKQVAAENNAVICSADDWFMRGGKYCFNPEQLGVAHMRCMFYATEACKNGKNVVVDNTNVFWRDIKTYVDIAMRFGYNVEVKVPSWSDELFVGGKWNVGFLIGKNTHGVSDSTLVDLANGYDYEAEKRIAELMNGGAR